LDAEKKIKFAAESLVKLQLLLGHWNDLSEMKLFFRTYKELFWLPE